MTQNREWSSDQNPVDRHPQRHNRHHTGPGQLMGRHGPHRERPRRSSHTGTSLCVTAGFASGGHRAQRVRGGPPYCNQKPHAHGE